MDPVAGYLEVVGIERVDRNGRDRVSRFGQKPPSVAFYMCPAHTALGPLTGLLQGLFEEVNLQAESSVETSHFTSGLGL